MATPLGTVLLVEDERSLRRLVGEFLRGEGYSVTEAADGPEGVARSAEAGPFGLAIVDLNLPGFSGVEVCRRILADRPAQKVLICSAAIVREAEDALRGLGIEDFLTKPYHPDVLLAYVAHLMRPKAPPRLGLVPNLALHP